MVNIAIQIESRVLSIFKRCKSTLYVNSMKIITITGFKGGVGKSTTAFHLAEYFASFGKTILVDGDPNRTAIKWVERSSVPLSFLVADQRQAVRVVTGKDFIIIDTPARPDSDDLKELAAGCDLLILPTSPDVVSLQPMIETAKALKNAHFRALITLVPPSPSKEGELMRADLEVGGIPVFKSMIRRTSGFTKAAFAGVSVKNVIDSRLKKAWQDYEMLGDEIRQII